MKLNLIASLFVFPLTLLDLSQPRAATCSCAGAPLANNINIANFEAESLNVSFSYVHSDISDLVAGSSEINDETGRSRETNSFLIKSTYGLNDAWALTAVTSYIEHQRNIAISNSDVEKSKGFGDSILLLSYAPQLIDPFTQDEWAYGLGIRIPSGENDNGSPIVYAEDLQPGQGAWGYSLWFRYAHAFNQQADVVYFVDGNYVSTNQNDRQYSFEDEWNLSTGLQYDISPEWSTNWSLNYRKASPHTRFGGEIPNTGGQWLDLAPAINYAISNQTNFSIAATIPIKRQLKGALQFTTKQSISLSIAHQF